MYEKDREEIIAEKMYKDIVLRRIEDYRKVLENEACNFVGDEIDEAVIKMCCGFTEKEKKIFIEMLRVISVDTVATLLAVLEGITGESESEPEIIIDETDMVPYLHSYFIQVDDEYIRERLINEV